ncbi:hypothetical protein [Bradyrhizobium lablabi]|uniref:hypothetical protein n=1 Tax=Bradyrhizobium lablabi TaxID=722472 RepID=UPI0012E3E32E|nr:hypothetical protein [Bradyrhizobium lablabi]
MRLVGVTSCELRPAVPLRFAIGVDGRVISVGISAALFGPAGFRRWLGRTNLRLSGGQMAVAAQHPDRFAAPRPVKCLEDAHKQPLALRTWSGLAITGVNAHR